MSDVADRQADAAEAPDTGLRSRARSGLSAATSRVETARERHLSIALPFRVVEREARVAASVLAGGFAYKLFLWLLPLGLILGGVFGISNTSSAEEAVRGGLVAAVINSIGDSTRATGVSPWWLLLIGVPGLLWAGRSGAKAAQLIYALIWDEPPPKTKFLPMSLAFTGILGAALVTVGLSWWFRDNTQLGSALLAIAAIVPIVGLSVWASLLLPHGDASWRELMPGAVLIGVGVVVLHELIGRFLLPKLQESAELYGVLGIMTTILFYMYWVAAIFVSSATLNHSLQEEVVSRHGEPGDAGGVRTPESPGP
jgi:membrane protein